MVPKFKVLFSLFIIVFLTVALPVSLLAKGISDKDWGSQKLCSILGDKERVFPLDIDAYSFYGKKGEKVRVTLSADPSGSHSGDRATLVLTSRFKPFLKIDRSPLPNPISTVLPAEGEYFVYVIEQLKGKNHKSFKGSYCLTLESSKDAWRSFKAIPSHTWSKHPITWMPERVEETLSRGTTKELKIAFISKVDLKKGNLWMTPELRPFININPNAFEKIEANTPYEVTLELTVPSDANLGAYDGTIHLRVGSRTYPETLKIKLNIVAAVNAPPVANAGPDQIITLPEGQTTIDVQLDGSGSYDPDGTIVSYIWTGTPDPEDVVRPTVQLKQGVYDFSLTVSDDKGASSSDTTKVTVLGPPLLMPIPEVTGESTIKIRGISIPGATISIMNNTTGVSKEILNERGFF